MKAAESFVQWCEENMGTWTPHQTALLQDGKIPRGWFADYVRYHEQLQKACRMSERVKKINVSYCRILRLYRNAVVIFISNKSTVVEAT